MSNEYIVVNTNKNNQTIWSTIASTYTPSKGEVCVIVPTGNAFEYSYSDADKSKEYDLSNVGVAIKIGDGKTVFKELPILTDVSTIHPDWHETDTSSPNYIWHKPITNDDMFVQSEAKALILTDQDILDIFKKNKTRTFHDEVYYFIKELGPNDFRHPNDLLIEEDNTWGHYDIFYNHSETNHEPRYFYQNNILRLTDALKYVESDVSYSYKLEIFLSNIILEVLKNHEKYASIFDFMVEEIDFIPEKIPVGEYTSIDLYRIKGTKDYYSYKEENGKGSFTKIEYYQFYRVQNYISSIGNDIGDYLIKHDGNIEQLSIYNILAETFVDYLDQLLLRQMSGHIYQQVVSLENRNEIEKGIVNGTRTYFEINNELIIDTSDDGLYFKKSRLDHFYETAHGVTEWTEIIEPRTETLQIPFKITSEMKFGDDFYVILQDINDGYSREYQDKEIGKGISELPYPFETLIGGSVKDEIGNLNLNIVFNNNTYIVTSEELQLNQPTNIIPQPEGCSFTKESFVNIYYDKRDIEWTEDYSDKKLEYFIENPIISLNYKEGLDISENLSKTKISILTEDKDRGTVQERVLKYFDDYLLTSDIDDNGNVVSKLMLIDAITEPCLIKYLVHYPEEKIEKYTWTYIAKEVESDDDEGLESSVIEIPGVQFENFVLDGDFSIIFREIGGERILKYYNVEDGIEVGLEKDPNGYTLDAVGNIILNQPITKPCTVNYNRLQGLSLESDDIDFTTGIITLKKPPIAKTIVYYRRNNLGEGNLKIKIYYKTRSLDAKFLSSLRPNWDTNSDKDLTYIFNRPFWLDTPGNDVHQIKMLAKDGLYSNGEKTYFEFFKKMIENVADEYLDAGIGDIWDTINAILAWKKRIEDYVDACMDYTKTDKNGNVYGEGVINALDQIIDKVADLDDRVKFLEGRSEIWISDVEPTESWYRVWINTSSGNGNGLLYYYNQANEVWTPISAMWSNTDGSQNI